MNCPSCGTPADPLTNCPRCNAFVPLTITKPALAGEIDSLRAQLSVAKAQALADRAFQSENAQLRALIAELRSAMTTCLTQLVGWQVLADPTDGATKDDQYAIAKARAVLGKVAP